MARLTRPLAAALPAFLFLTSQACGVAGTSSPPWRSRGSPDRPRSFPLSGSSAAGQIGVTNSSSVVGDSCQSSDPNHVCLALKYVVYVSGAGDPTISEDDAVTNVRGINSLWQQCNIGFQIDQFEQVDPTDYGLLYHIANYTDLEAIRNQFETLNTLLVTTTGSWDRTGTLGTTSANAWTALPGGAPYGAILEYSVGQFYNIIAHELGHYLNLQHVADNSDLMNPIIYTTSTTLTPEQCQAARSTATTFWNRMLR